MVPYGALQNADLDSQHSKSIDQVAGARHAVQHLIYLSHTEIMHISGPQCWREAEARMQGYLEAINGSDLRTRPPILDDSIGRGVVGTLIFRALALMMLGSTNIGSFTAEHRAFGNGFHTNVFG